MTDNEIKKALVWHSNDETHCSGCPYEEHSVTHYCVDMVIQDALDLINRQQADNERLKKLLEEADVNYNKCAKRFYKEGVKEFAERLKATCYTYSDICGYKSTVIDINEIDNLVKEMVGDAE